MYSAKHHALYLRESLQWNNKTDKQTDIYTDLHAYLLLTPERMSNCKYSPWFLAR
jgi:hypothetical protein